VAVASSWAAGRDERSWPDAERFDPDRFLALAPARHRYAVFPFGGGARQCIGERLAWLEAVLVLGTVLGRFALSPLGPLPAPRAGASLEPAEPLRIRLSRRQAGGGTP
jgi:cytochrome P450